MSLYGMMRTSVSGMMSLAGRLSAISDNIANAGTNGYKRSSVEFGTQVLDGNGTNYNSGSISTTTRYAISSQGALRSTGYATDLAISGNGFFIVGDGNTNYLTRAGSFLVDSEGKLVNSSGQVLKGYDLRSGNSSAVVNGYSGLVPINIGLAKLQASATTTGTLSVNLPSKDEIADSAYLPSSNVADAEYSGKTSMVVYDDLGGERTLDIYFSKTADGEWEVAVFDASEAGDPDAFPYASGPLVTETLEFDSDGYLTDTSASSLTIPVPGGGNMTLDLSETSQLASDYSVQEAEADGNAPGSVERIEIDNDGTVYGIYDNGYSEALFQIAMAKVPSPDNLKPLSGNNFSATIDSGDVQVGTAGSEGFGTITSGALEESNVDLATELTIMIETQRSYQADSKVFQTGSDLMDVLINLQR